MLENILIGLGVIAVIAAVAAGVFMLWLYLTLNNMH